MRHTTRQASRIADALRVLATRVEEKKPYPSSDGAMANDYIRMAHEIVHDLQWGFANLPVDSLLDSALEVDRYVRAALAASDHAKKEN